MLDANLVRANDTFISACILLQFPLLQSNAFVVCGLICKNEMLQSKKPALMF